MRPWQNRQREPKRRHAKPLVAVRPRDVARPLRIELDTGAKDQHIPLEWRQIEGRAQHVKGRRCASPSRNIDSGWPFFTAVLNRRAALERRAHACHGGKQLRAVPVFP
jgi:hypothetical protein